MVCVCVSMVFSRMTSFKEFTARQFKTPLRSQPFSLPTATLSPRGLRNSDARVCASKLTVSVVVVVVVCCRLSVVVKLWLSVHDHCRDLIVPWYLHCLYS